MQTKTVTLNILHAGQPRAYADSIYEGVFTFSWSPEQKEVLAYAKLMLHEYYDTPPHPVAPVLDKCERRGTKEWYVKIIAPYTG